MTNKQKKTSHQGRHLNTTPRYPLQSTYTGSLGNLFGGANEDRTRDLLVANETLSQLSYSPIATK